MESHSYQVVEETNPEYGSGFYGGVHHFRIPPRVGEHIIIDEAVDRFLHEVVHVIHRPSDADKLPVLIVRSIPWLPLIQKVELL